MQTAATQEEPLDKEFAICALDFLNGVVEAPTGRGSRLNEAISWSRGNTQHDAAPARIPVTLLERAPQRHNAPRPTVAVINERHLAPASDVTWAALRSTGYQSITLPTFHLRVTFVSALGISA